MAYRSGKKKWLLQNQAYEYICILLFEQITRDTEDRVRAQLRQEDYTDIPCMRAVAPLEQSSTLLSIEIKALFSPVNGVAPRVGPSKN